MRTGLALVTSSSGAWQACSWTATSTSRRSQPCVRSTRSTSTWPSTSSPSFESASSGRSSGGRGSTYHRGMPEQYGATDKRAGLDVSVTGAFPDHPQGRIRIARTTNLFTKLTATILDMEQESDRREAFRAFEVQMEVAEALIRQDMD